METPWVNACEVMVTALVHTSYTGIAQLHTTIPSSAVYSRVAICHSGENMDLCDGMMEALCNKWQMQGEGSAAIA